MLSANAGRAAALRVPLTWLAAAIQLHGRTRKMHTWRLAVHHWPLAVPLPLRAVAAGSHHDPWPRRSPGERPKAITLAPGCAAFNAGARMAGVYACGSGTTGAPEEQQALCTGESAGATHRSCQQGPPMRAQERRKTLQGLQLAPRGQVWTRTCVRAIGEAAAAKLSFCAARLAKRSGGRRVADERYEGRRPARGAREAPAARGVLLAGTRLVQSQ